LRVLFRTAERQYATVVALEIGLDIHPIQFADAHAVSCSREMADRRSASSSGKIAAVDLAGIPHVTIPRRIDREFREYRFGAGGVNGPPAYLGGLRGTLSRGGRRCRLFALTRSLFP